MIISRSFCAMIMQAIISSINLKHLVLHQIHESWQVLFHNCTQSCHKYMVVGFVIVFLRTILICLALSYPAADHLVGGQSSH